MARLNQGDVCEYPLGSGAVDYVKGTLGQAGSLARAVLSTRTFSSPFTFFVCGLDATALERLDLGQRWKFRNAVWQDWIHRFLDSTASSLVLAEIFGVSPTAPFLKQRKAIWCVGEEAFTYSDGASRASVDVMLRNMSPFPAVVVLSDRGRELVAAGGPSLQDITHIAAGARYVLVGAYDDESFVAMSCR